MMKQALTLSLVPAGLAAALLLFTGASNPDPLFAGRPAVSEDFDEAMLFLEKNATDGDLGLHFKVDGEGWRRVTLRTPMNQKLVDLHVQGNLGREIGLTELFSESAEPGFDELPEAEFLALFPPGCYSFQGLTLDGCILSGDAELTHTMPDDPVLITPTKDAEVDADSDLALEWGTVADPPGSAIEFYEIVVEKDEEDELLRVATAIMLPGDNNYTVPAEFFEAGKDYKVEIIAQETSGNRVAIEVPFSTGD